MLVDTKIVTTEYVKDVQVDVCDFLKNFMKTA